MDGIERIIEMLTEDSEETGAILLVEGKRKGHYNDEDETQIPVDENICK